WGPVSDLPGSAGSLHPLPLSRQPSRPVVPAFVLLSPPETLPYCTSRLALLRHYRVAAGCRRPASVLPASSSASRSSMCGILKIKPSRRALLTHAITTAFHYRRPVPLLIHGRPSPAGAM